MIVPVAENEGSSPWRFCVAPMMQKTDRHFRYLLRLLSPNMRLYTEMVNTGAILHGQRERFLHFDPIEHPLALQLGGADPSALAAAAAIAADWGYDEVNLNCGCPSDRVQSGAFGACLMRTPALVSDCVSAMIEAVPSAMAISVKCRLGVDDLYSYAYFSDFVGQIAAVGCTIFHVHARKAWLAGLSPRENREIPPLEYDWVYRLKSEYPHLKVIINGGISSLEQTLEHLNRVDGVMLGRAAYDNPYAMAHIDRVLFDTPAVGRREAILDAYLEHIERECAGGTYLKHMSRHLLNFFQGQAGARQWRRTLSTDGVLKDADARLIRNAIAERLAVEQTMRTPSLAS